MRAPFLWKRAAGLSPLMAVLLAVLMGCAQRGPSDPPAVGMPSQFKQGPAVSWAGDGARPAAPAVPTDWWTLYGDEALNRLQAQWLTSSPWLAAGDGPQPQQPGRGQ